MSIIVFNTPWPQPSAPSLLWFVVAGQPLCVRSAVRGFGLIPERDATLDQPSLLGGAKLGAHSFDASVSFCDIRSSCHDRCSTALFAAEHRVSGCVFAHVSGREELVSAGGRQ
jgi:hypothetical protein